MAADYSKAQREAERILEECFVTDVPVPVVEIAESLGLRVVLGEFPQPDVAGLIDLNQQKIIANAEDHPNRRAFTIAHEIGHFILHRDRFASSPGVGILYRKPIGGEFEPVEQEATS
jgi:Zn-dependent peptidase ImmA (M78 family)